MEEQTSPSRIVQVINTSKGGTIVATRVEWAGTSARRRKGLSGRNELAKESGIYLVPCEGVHTIGMKFPIDVVFLDSEGTVLAIHHGLKPWRISKIVFRADGVLELAAGRLRETNTGIGDVLEFRQTTPEV